MVIRGGQLESGRILRRAIKDRERLGGVFGVSAFAAVGLTLADLVSKSIIPHMVLQQSTALRIRSAGFGIYWNGRWPHCTIDLGPEPSEDRIDDLIAVFDAPETTPGRKPS